MGCSGVPTAVFTETNLGTCLAVPASPDITADDFKREVERVHLNCFPEFGTIMVKAVMVITYRGLCLSIELGSASPEKRTKCKRKIKVGRFLKISTALCFRRKWKRKNAKKNPETRHPILGRTQPCLVEKEMLCEFATEAEVNSESNVIGEATGETISVSGIINKYFSDYDEVASNPKSLSTTARYRCWKQRSRCEYRSSVVKSPVYPPSSEKHKTPNIGKGLLVASASLGLTPSNGRSILSLYRHNHGESMFHEFSAAVFEMADE